MTTIELSTKLDLAAQRFARAFVSHVLSGCDPRKLVSESVDFKRFNSPTHVLAFGKASTKMAQACVLKLGPRFAGGIVLTPDALGPSSIPDDALKYFGVDHPAPTARNVSATDALAQYARSIPAGHNCIVCISGGGSAHLCCPNPGVTLEQINETTESLNARGASIHELNKARRSLETLKGGGLAEVLGHVSYCQAIVLSDVLGDHLDIIASGPMENPDLPVEHTIIGNHQTALDAAEEFIIRQVSIGVCSAGIGGDSSDRGRELADTYLKSGQMPCMIAGETTVDAAHTVGVGGPCMELALACAIYLAQSGNTEWVVLGLATDGVDGPSNAAGAVIVSESLRTPRLQVIATEALNGHNTLPFLDSIHSTIRTGPTGTNLNDLCLVCSMGTMGHFNN